MFQYAMRFGVSLFEIFEPRPQTFKKSGACRTCSVGASRVRRSQQKNNKIGLHSVAVFFFCLFYFSPRELSGLEEVENYDITI